MTNKLRNILGVGASLILASCASIESRAPLVETLRSPRTSKESARLVMGREIYTSKCARCHAAQPVRNYSRSRWNDILSKMEPLAALNPAQTDVLQAYIAAVLDSPVTTSAR